MERFVGKLQLMKAGNWIVGIDEVGRGPLAGPVVVVAAAIPLRAAPKRWSEVPLRDSKRLSEREREEWRRVLLSRGRAGEFAYAASSVSAPRVDRMGISNAANRAATRALRNLLSKTGIPPSRVRVFLDGGLFIEPDAKTALRVRTETLVRGDERVPAIALASILAKVRRDRYMVRLHARVPGYGFAKHKGYGTEFHRKAISRKGPSAEHRLTFIRNLARMRK